MRILERETQLAALREYAADAARSVGRLVLVEGEAGIGKSTLLDQLEAELTGATWAWGACEGLRTPRPLAPLRDLAEELGGELLEACREQAPRDALFDGLITALRSAEGLHVLVFEDVHWADDATLDLLRHLARRVQRLPVLVLVTFRDEDSSARLRLALGELVRQRSVRRVTLPALSVEAIRALVAGTDLRPAEVHRLTGGNPYYVAELLVSGPDGLARTARDSVRARVEALSPDARRAVEAGALLGARLDPGLLVEVSGVDGAVCDELVAAGLLVVDRPTLRFRHEITRLAVAETVLPFHAVEIHRRALAALEGRASADHARMAFHAEQAGLSDAVVGHAVRAAREAAGLNSHREAVDHYRRALRFTTDDEGVLQGALAQELGLLDQWVEAEQLWRQVLELTRRQGRERRYGDALQQHSRALWRLSRGAEARAAAEAALAVLRPLGPGPELARALAHLGGMLSMHGDAAAGAVLGREALALAEDAGLPETAADALNVIAFDEIETGGAWDASLRRALEIARDCGARNQAGRCYVNLYGNYVDLLRIAEGERTFHEGLAYIEEHEVPVYGYCMLASRAEALEMTGRWAESVAIAADLREAVMSPINRMHLDLGPTRVAVRSGAADATERLERLLPGMLSTQEPQWVVPGLLLRAEWHWLAGRTTDAADDVRTAAATGGSPFLQGRTGLWLQRLGLPTPAPTMLPEPFATQLCGRYADAAAAWERAGLPYEAALARLDSGDPDQVLAALDDLLRLGAEPAAAVARRRLRAAGVRPTAARQATLAHPAGLTEREQDVLALVCDGRSNADIATELVISVKTAGHHVSAVLGKLGVGTRQEAAALALRTGLVAPDLRPNVAQDGDPAAAR
ncbi:MAG TPA: AAA family ATPase [Nocardioides sp.]|nr:AAA family ATPase [Nocardioides sp.]